MFENKLLVFLFLIIGRPNAKYDCPVESAIAIAPIRIRWVFSISNFLVTPRSLAVLGFNPRHGKHITQLGLHLIYLRSCRIAVPSGNGNMRIESAPADRLCKNLTMKSCEVSLKWVLNSVKQAHTTIISPKFSQWDSYRIALLIMHCIIYVCAHTCAHTYIMNRKEWQKDYYYISSYQFNATLRNITISRVTGLVDVVQAFVSVV